MTKKLLALDYHRNGVCGTGFYVALFRDDDGSRKICTWFGSTDPDSENDDMACAVLDVNAAAAGNIAMALGNAWRGDHYVDDMRRWVARYSALEKYEDRRRWEVGNMTNGVEDIPA
jgi:hypothetical protein